MDTSQDYWLKPKFDNNNFEESFSTWEFELQRFERDNGQTLPDAVKIAVPLNETSGPFQQHLQLLSGQSPSYTRVKQTIIEYYRPTTAFSKLQQLRTQSSSVATNFAGGQAPTMDIDAIRKGKDKYNSNKGKGKGKGKHKGKGYGGYNGYGYNNYNNNYKGKGKYGGKGFNNYNNIPIGFGNPFGRGNKGNKGFSKGYNKGKGKNKGKQATDACYRCGRTGHYAKDCRVAIHNIGQGESNDFEDTTTQWYDDYTRQPQQIQQPLALPPIASTSNRDMTPIHVIAMISNGNDHKSATTNYTHHDRQWSSHTCLPTMVRRQLSRAQDRPSTKSKPQDSDKQDNTMLWREMGLHAIQRTTNCHTLLCV